MNKAKKPLIIKLSSGERLKILANLIIDRILEETNKDKSVDTQLST